MIRDPFDGTEVERRIVVTPVQETKKKYPSGRALAAAFWLSYFALHWLLILEVIETTWQRSSTTLFFLLTSIIVSINVAAHDAKEKKK